MHLSDEPTTQVLRRAREEFTEMLGRSTPESAWQRFFAANPYVLARGLPLRLLPCDILPFGRRGRSEPDFLLYPGSEASGRIHGVVELKTNHARILSRPRKTELILSRDAATAASQVVTYDRLYDTFVPERRILTLESISHLFVIMGERRELEAIEEAMLPRLKELMSTGIRFLTFDDVLDSYANGLPKPVALLQRLPDTIKQPVPRETTPLVDRILAALADGPLNNREICERLGIPPAALARQLHGLRAAGLVVSRTVGRTVFNNLSLRGTETFRRAEGAFYHRSA